MPQHCAGKPNARQSTSGLLISASQDRAATASWQPGLRRYSFPQLSPGGGAGTQGAQGPCAPAGWPGCRAGMSLPPPPAVCAAALAATAPAAPTCISRRLALSTAAGIPSAAGTAAGQCPIYSAGIAAAHCSGSHVTQIDRPPGFEVLSRHLVRTRIRHGGPRIALRRELRCCSAELTPRCWRARGS